MFNLLRESERYITRGKNYLDYRIFLLRYGQYEACIKLEERLMNGTVKRVDLVDVLGNEKIVEQFAKYYRQYVNQSKESIPKMTITTDELESYQNPVYVQSIPSEIRQMKKHTLLPSEYQNLAKRDIQRKEMRNADLLINNRYFPSDYERVVYELTIIKESKGRIDIMRRSEECERI